VQEILAYFLLHAILLPSMTEYGFAHSQRIVLSSSVQEKKAARKKLLEAVEGRRAENYIRFIQKKRQLQANSDLL
jgi:hypothetical protein